MYMKLPPHHHTHTHILTGVQVMEYMVERAQSHEHTDSVDIGMRDDCQQRENIVVIEDPEGEEKRTKQREERWKRRCVEEDEKKKAIVRCAQRSKTIRSTCTCMFVHL